MQDDDEMDELYSTIMSLIDGIEEDVDHVEEDHLGEEASEMMRHPISKRCWALYNNQNALFLLYCVIMHDQDLLMDNAVQDLDGVLLEFPDLPELKQGSLQQKAALLLLNEVDCPVKLDQMMWQHFLQYLLSLRSSEGNRLLDSTCCNKCAELFHLFGSFGQTQSLELQNQLKTAMAGLRQSVAIEK